VDEQGVLLPRKVAQMQRLPILYKAPRPAGAAGQRWGDSGVHAAAQAAMQLKPHLRALRQQDVLSRLMGELGAAFPALKAVLIDERDAYLAENERLGTITPGQPIPAPIQPGDAPTPFRRRNRR
jgi:hypothetical protein